MKHCKRHYLWLGGLTLVVLAFMPAFSFAQQEEAPTTPPPIAATKPDKPKVPELFTATETTAPTDDIAGDPPVVGEETAPEQTTEEKKAKTRQEAFDAAFEGLMPLKPDEIRTLLEKYDDIQKSVAEPYSGRPKPIVSVENASLEPGAEPLTVQVAQGNVTTVTFLDSTGSPWPIEDTSWAGDFEVVESGGEDGSHILRITPQSEFAHGNMSIRLLDLKTPVILTLNTARDIVHYRLDIIVPGYGPLAKAPLIEGGQITITAGKVEISRILAGVVPEAFKRLEVVGADGRTSAYADGPTTYLRTPLTLLSPSWSAHASSSDGMHVYVIEQSPVVLLSDKGQMVRVHLSDRKEVGALDE